MLQVMNKNSCRHSKSVCANYLRASGPWDLYCDTGILTAHFSHSQVGRMEKIGQVMAAVKKRGKQTEGL